ncbi:CarboxypepD_reg-like domain-containing protein [Hymenobacter daecheongensis DSM 21074]|uniref:CarboxypepD_reg-like domain-containing protein n=1 Tax=Hymenobacter daecheongensis DSM 21074 TaxID=1121955 RepID=A0A1M6E7Z7_9BACT|nr:carboxypeptidase-like regulatory domain-containing protein [Hymenobacter daecheongensis]SHI81592.1 CarboxypepD_reg-like domain-containing protein [Hymenobacter daecheongensis DSM 21074]
MPTENYTPDPENNDIPLEDEEQALSSGNGKLAMIVGGVVLLAGLGYAFVPDKTGKSAISSVMPSITLGDATVTGSRPADEEAAATTEEAKPDEEKAQPATATVAARPVTRPVAGTATTTTASAAQPAAAPVVEEAAPAPAPAAAAEPANVTLSGRILDEEGQPMAGATVMLKGSRKVTSTDANGNYSLEVPAGDNTLSYGYGGYQDQEMRARGSQPINVTLLPKETGKRRRK